MLKRVIRIALAIAGASAGMALGVFIMQLPVITNLLNIPTDGGLFIIILPVVLAILSGLITFMISPMIIRSGIRIAKYTERELEKIPTSELVVGTIGLILGLIIAYLISNLFGIIPIPFISQGLSIVSYIFLGYVGASFATRNLSDISRLPELLRRSSNTGSKAKATETSGARPKVLDTSVIIDGRIADICRTGFIEGPIVIAEFVLEELRHIADSSDSLKRNRGRRGLDILRTIQQEINADVQIVDTDFEDVNEVDIKLLKLAQSNGGVVVTNDFNLNKVASLQGVDVLNINELANAVKPVVLPGEEMVVTIMKEGKESNQGVAYLDDGTMIVVEGGRKFMNQTKTVLVTSVLQTSAGRMIFAKPVH